MTTVYRCACRNVEFGTYENTVILPFPDHMAEHVNRRMRHGLLSKNVTIDTCVVEDVKLLWENGIETYGSCCGHNKAVPMINIDKNRMSTALRLGFKPYFFEYQPDRLDTVIPKCIPCTQFTGTQKGFTALLDLWDLKHEN